MKALLTCLFIAGVCAFAQSPAKAQIIVGGEGDAYRCYMKTKLGDKGRAATIKLCESALDDKALVRKERAATLVNLGILRMRLGEYDAALADYDQALTLNNRLAEVHINRGASLIYLGRPSEAITSLTKSLKLGTKKKPEALFNRAMAYEATGDLKAAYYDLRDALALRPDWEPASRMMSRFSVSAKPKG